MQSPEYKQRIKQKIEENKLKEKIISQSAHFTGHRPDNKYMFGYDLKHPGYKIIIDKTTEIIEMLINNEGTDKFISGGAIGFDTIAFWCVHKLKNKYPHIKNIVAVSFRDQPSVRAVFKIKKEI